MKNKKSKNKTYKIIFSEEKSFLEKAKSALEGFNFLQVSGCIIVSSNTQKKLWEALKAVNSIDKTISIKHEICRYNKSGALINFQAQGE